MYKRFNYAIAISDPDPSTNDALWSIYDFGVGKRLTSEAWKPASNGGIEKDSAAFHKALVANKNIISIAIDNIDLSKPINKNFPKLTVGKHYNQIHVQVNQFRQGKIYKDTSVVHVEIDGHASPGEFEIGDVDNEMVSRIILFEVSVVQTKVLTIPAGVFIGGGAGTFVSAICRVAGGRVGK
jgi:hypothetical protein